MAGENYRTVIPYLVVSDADAEIRFLQAAFGGKLGQCERHPDGNVMHAEIEIGDSLVMLGQAHGPWAPRNAAFYLWQPDQDVDAVYARALAAGARRESPPEDKPYGHRQAGVNDPSGLTWWIAAPIKRA